MVSEKMLELGTKRSCIRELFEFGLAKAAEIGKENVYDFSLGNPSVPAPQAVTDAILDIIKTQEPVDVHGYTSAAGDNAVRETIAKSLNARFGVNYSGKNIYMTCGAAAALASTFKALTLGHATNFIAIAPHFPEYRCFVEATGANLTVVPPKIPDFQVDFDALESMITANTQGVVINSPSNPSGVVYTEETIMHLAKILTDKSAQFGHAIYLISDEPYRELVYGGVAVHYVPKYYANTIVCYSYSKALSLPGERIGYVLVPPEVENSVEVFNAIAGAARAIGYVCAPALMQKVVARCVDVAPDLASYKKNRDLLYSNLTAFGYECVKPDGAFYMFVKAPGGDAAAFAEKAKQRNLLIVPADDFGCPGYLRISYCVSTDMIERALPAFKAILEA